MAYLKWLISFRIRSSRWKLNNDLDDSAYGTVNPVTVWEYSSWSACGSAAFVVWRIMLQRRNLNPLEDSLQLGSDTVVLDSRARKLIGDVMNLPGKKNWTVWVSVANYKELYIQIKDRKVGGHSSVITMWGHRYRLLRKNHIIDTSKNPCFVFTRLSIKNDTATVQMVFEWREVLCQGKCFIAMVNGSRYTRPWSVGCENSVVAIHRVAKIKMSFQANQATL